MKFNMMIGGIETLFPENDACYFEEENRIIVYFLNIDKVFLDRIKKCINKPIMKFEENYLLLILNDFQYALNLKDYSTIVDLYFKGVGIGFAFEDENGKLLDISVPTFYK